MVAPPLREDPYEPLDPTLTVAQRLPAVPPGAPPVVREVLDGSPTRHGREYIGTVTRDRTPAFWVARPFVATADGTLLGHRPARRAEALIELAESVGGVDPAARLRVADFLHPTPKGLRRHALLASFVDAALSGRLGPEATS